MKTCAGLSLITLHSHGWEKQLPYLIYEGRGELEVEAKMAFAATLGKKKQMPSFAKPVSSTGAAFRVKVAGTASVAGTLWNMRALPLGIGATHSSN